jgi:hypothetical protein
VNGTFGATRATTILGSSLYKLPAPSDAMVFDGRDGLQRLGTDYMWKCSSWSFARNWVQHGGRAFVGLYTIGATYPDSEGIPFCVQSGSVCHESDIEIVVCDLHPVAVYQDVRLINTESGSSGLSLIRLLHKPLSPSKYKNVTRHSFRLAIPTLLCCRRGPQRRRLMYML